MYEHKGNFVVSKENWSLHRKGYQDQTRHMDKVKDAIKNNLPDLVSEENIIMSNGKDVIKVPIRSLDEYKIRYNYDKTKHVGQGKGDSQVGDIIARAPGGDGQATDKEKKAGDQPGTDYYEAEISLEEIENALFQELELPNLQAKEQAEIITEKIEFNDVRKKGLMGNIDKKRTILTAIKRNATEGRPGITPIYEDDLRFKTWNDITKPETKAVVLAMMDTSASMGIFEKYVARSFFFWMTRFLRTKYETVEIEFIAHHTEAKVVSKEEFFSKGESGGTICSSVYLKGLELINSKYPPARYNIYPVHFSDGENMTSDNPLCIELVEEMMRVSSMFGYGEVNSYHRRSTLMRTFDQIHNPKFRYYIVKEKKDIYEALKAFFTQQVVMV
ncbi:MULTISPECIES: sporulation protein YhbH [Clostridia]|uniref:sporulation protein YhbH n=1 Tax=Clostridia TaxID=186801 RepID=UPI000EA1B35D|nr:MULTISPECIES: sporulation protein YhbH [Clostridia]NBJ69449.1 sporulation protein YhbH [Roseburia sp. 1XD42-34]RKI78524.1 sporulation protein YhbH [Clostridium sp. 1xD42-85]